MTDHVTARYGSQMVICRQLKVISFVVFSIALCAGCPSHRTSSGDRLAGALTYPSGDLPGIAYGKLPDSIKRLIRIADHTHLKSRNTSKLIKARTALKKALEKRPNSYGVLWRLARVSSVLSLRDKKHAAGWARECYEAAIAAKKVNPARVEGFYFAASCSGLRAQHEPGRASKLLEELIEHAEQAHELSPKYDKGGPRRTLGIVYTLAPPWPSGVGDLDEAIELLEEVQKEFPKEPLNAFYLGEAYRKAEQYGKARGLYKRAYRLGKKGLFGPEGSYYRKRIESALYQLRRNQ